jgi:hypothetical protein
MDGRADGVHARTVASNGRQEVLEHGPSNREIVQIKQWVDCLKIARRLDAEGWHWVAILNILQGIVVEVDIVGN